MVYGALPPETRRQQAALFNEAGNSFDVMVASDAVGMGLNLNVRLLIKTSYLDSIFSCLGRPSMSNRSAVLPLAEQLTGLT